MQGKFQGERLRALRKERREQQVVLAVIIGVERSFISKLEKGEGKPSLDTLLAIAAHYGVSPDYLLGWSDSRLPVQGEQAGNQLNERALEALFRRVISETGGLAEPLRLEGPRPDAQRKRAGKAKDHAA